MQKNSDVLRISRCFRNKFASSLQLLITFIQKTERGCFDRRLQLRFKVSVNSSAAVATQGDTSALCLFDHATSLQVSERYSTRPKRANVTSHTFSLEAFCIPET